MPVQIEQHAERDDRREQPADELNEPRPDQIANPLGVAS